MDMENERKYLTPSEVVEVNIKAGEAKGNLPLFRMILLGILAGAFIAIGGEASNLAVHGIKDVGLARTLAGAIFPVGLMMIVLIGGELFTGNCMMIMAVLDKKTTWLKYGRNLLVVYFSNLLGALLVDFLLFFCGQWNYSNGGLGAYTIKVAYAKIGLEPLQGFTSGIMCNILVCVAVLMAISAKDIVGKIFAIFFPIWAFVISGFEHCVANMFYIPAGILASTNENYVAKAEELYGITAAQAQTVNVAGMVKNMVPVTLGNIVGGAICVGVFLMLIYKKDWSKKKQS